MTRLHRFARPRSWLMVVPLVPLVLLAGCRSSSNSQNSGGCCGGGGGGGGCCRGTTPTNPPAVAARSDSAAVASASALPASRGDAVAANASSSPAQGLYGGQKTCPVTGEPLGDMGTPIPVTVKGQTLYVCCRGCVAKVQRDPDGYLRKVLAERGEQSHGTL